MKETDFENLCSRMLDASPGMESSLDFSLLCMSAGVSSEEADELLYSEFGMSGTDILENLYKSSTVVL